MGISLDGGTGVITGNAVILAGSTSGSVRVQANAISGSVTLILPSANGNLVAQPAGTSTVNGSLLIGNTVSGGFDLNLLTQGTGIAITNDKGSITIAATGGSAIDQYARDKANGAVQTGFPIINVAGQNNIVATSNSNTLILVAGTGMTITTDNVNNIVTFVSAGGVSSVAGKTGAVVLDTNDVAENTSSNLWFTAARVRANVSNTTPIRYEPSTGVFSHADSGVVATGHGDGATVPKLIVDAGGHVTSVTNTAIAISAAAITSGTLAVARGGTGQTAITVNGSLLIGNTVSGGFDVNPITQGTNITITNDKGSVTIASSDAFAQIQANAAFDRANTAYANANTAIYTATQIRANISNTAPINYEASTGVISHADSGVVATGHGDAATIPKVVVNASGHVTSVTNTSIAIAASQITSGTLAVARGGTGQTAITVNGSLLIGNTVSGGFDVNALTQGTGIEITNDKGSITIAATGGSAIDQFARDHSNGAFDKANGAIYTAAQIRANISNTAPINYDSSTGVISHALSGATASGYGDAATVAKVVVDSNGHVTSVTNTAIAIAASQITSGVLIQAQGGTGFAGATANGQLLIGNTVSGGFDRSTLTQGANITITNAKGSITIDAAGGGGPGFGDIQVSGQGSLVADQANDVLTLVGTTPITITTDAGTDTATWAHATSGVTATGHGDAATVPKFLVDDKGHITSVTNTAIAISAAAVTSGVLAVGVGGTGQTAVSLVNGAILIGNTVSGGYDLNTLTQGTNITITNDKGSVTIAAAGGGGDSFGTIAVSGQSNIVADQTNDTLTVAAGTGVTITTDAGTDTITIAAADAFASAQANAAFNAANAASTLGIHTIWIPAWAMYPTGTNGASAANGLFELVTNDLMLKTLDFDTTTSEKAQFNLKLGNSWNLGTITAVVVWSHGTTTTNFGVSWSVAGRAFSDNEAGDAALGTPMVFSDTGGTANNIYISPASGGITIGGTPADGDWIIMEVLRSVANASDTMAIDARLHGVELTYTTDASTDV